jgi:plastocyanin
MKPDATKSMMTTARTHRLIWAASMLAGGIFAVTAMAATDVAVMQKGRMFSMSALTISRGDTVRFTNEDEFPHQLDIAGPGMHLVSDLQDPDVVIPVQFAQPGLFTVRCGIHPRMRLTLTVE